MERRRRNKRMPRIRLATRIEAPPERVFDLARSIDLHARGQARHRERAIAGVTSGLIGLGQTVTWEARHFGITQRLTSQIVAFDRPGRSATRWCRAPSPGLTTTTFSK